MNRKPLKKVWIISGEESGDIYGAQVIRELQELHHKDDLKISVMGGPRMKATGAELMVDATELGVVGILEVCSMLFTFIRIFRNLVKRAVSEKPDCVLLIDYPGFNLRFARQMYKLDIPVIWYISPQIWAWKKGRLSKLVRYCRKMLVIFPFETDIYQGTGLDAEFVGHPLVDIVRKRRNPEIVRDDNTVLLLPGSRSNEINRLFLPMLNTAVKLYEDKPELRFVIAAPREKIYLRLQGMLDDFLEKNAAGSLPEFKLTVGETSRWMQEAGTGLAASGTVTVECAIAGLPLTVVYKLNPLTFFIAKRLVDIPFFTMVNIIAGKEVFNEYLQQDVNPFTLTESIRKILPDGSRRSEVERDIAHVAEILSSGSESAGKAVAREISEIAALS